MEKKNTIDQQPQITYAEAVRQRNWGAGNRSYRLQQNQDKYLAGTIPDQQPSQQTQDLEKLPRPEGLPEGISLADIARLAELFRS